MSQKHLRYWINQKNLHLVKDNGTLELCCCLEVWLYQAIHWTIWATDSTIKIMGFWNCIVAWRSDSIKLNAEPFELLIQPKWESGTTAWLDWLVASWALNHLSYGINQNHKDNGSLELRRDLLQAERWTIWAAESTKINFMLNQDIWMKFWPQALIWGLDFWIYQEVIKSIWATESIKKIYI